MSIMNESDVHRWFGGYFEARTACGRGERDPAALLAYYSIPLLVTTEAGFVALTTETEELAAARREIDEMRADDYGHSEILSSDVTILNATSALYRWTLSRRRSDGGEVRQATFTYLLTDSVAGRRISAVAFHSP